MPASPAKEGPGSPRKENDDPARGMGKGDMSKSFEEKILAPVVFYEKIDETLALRETSVLCKQLSDRLSLSKYYANTGHDQLKGAGVDEVIAYYECSDNKSLTVCHVTNHQSKRDQALSTFNAEGGARVPVKGKSFFSSSKGASFSSSKDVSSGEALPGTQI